jgi:hypothetical protein
MHIFPRKTQAIIVFVYAFAHLSVVLYLKEIYFTGVTIVDHSYYLCILMNKMIAVSFCYKDGMPEYEEKLLDMQKETKLTKIPTFIELLSYCSYPGNG